MFLRAGPAVVGLRAPRTATPELRECRLTGDDAPAVAWTVAARRASSAACRARRRSTPASLRCSATGRLFLEIRRVDRRLRISVPSCPVRYLSGVLSCWLRGRLAVLTNRGMLDGGAGVVIAA